MGGCAGSQATHTAECCTKGAAEQPVTLLTGNPKVPLFLGVAVCQEDSTQCSKEEVHLGIAEEPGTRRAKDSMLVSATVGFGVEEDAECSPRKSDSEEDPATSPSKVTFSVTDEPKHSEKEPAKTLLEDLSHATNGTAMIRQQSEGPVKKGIPLLPIIPRSKSEQDLGSPPPLPRARSAPVMLPAAAVRSRSLPRMEADEASPTPMAATLPETRSPTTALALSRRRKRRSVTFGAAECKEFMVEATLSDLAAA